MSKACKVIQRIFYLCITLCDVSLDFKGKILCQSLLVKLLLPKVMLRVHIYIYIYIYILEEADYPTLNMPAQMHCYKLTINISPNMEGIDWCLLQRYYSKKELLNMVKPLFYRTE